jgi:hypothetical protein
MRSVSGLWKAFDPACLQCQLSIPALEPAILGFQFLDPHQPEELPGRRTWLFSFIVSGRTNPVLAPYFVGRQPGIRFLENLHDLAIRES